jgi:Family of unknown function (DUF6069)
MTATSVSTATPTPTKTPTKTRSGAKARLWKTGAVAGVAAAAATTGFAALAQAADVSLKVGGEAIPVLAFAQMTLVGAIIGTILAVVLSRRAQRPQRTFVVTTVAMTALTFIPDLTADASSGTKLVLALSHVLAAAIVIPALASRLSD